MYQGVRSNNQTFSGGDTRGADMFRQSQAGSSKRELFTPYDPTQAFNPDSGQLPTVNSPGGVANVNFYTSQYESGDIFGGSNPRYIYGEYGNLYGRGQSAGTIEYGATPVMVDTGAPGPGGTQIPYWQVDYPRPAARVTESFEPQASLAVQANPLIQQGTRFAESGVSPDMMSDALERKKQADREPYEWLGDRHEPFHLEKKDGKLKLKLDHPVLDVVVLVVAYIALMFLQRFVAEYFSETFADGNPTWKQYLLWAMGFGVLAVVIIVVAKHYMKTA